MLSVEATQLNETEFDVDAVTAKLVGAVGA